MVRDEDGRPLFLQGVAFDITGIKQAEEDLQALNQTLEQRVAERTDGGRASGGGTGSLEQRHWSSSATWSPTTCASRCAR